jgi:hypothetical protein
MRVSHAPFCLLCAVRGQCVGSLLTVCSIFTLLALIQETQFIMEKAGMFGTEAGDAYQVCAERFSMCC